MSNDSNVITLEPEIDSPVLVYYTNRDGKKYEKYYGKIIEILGSGLFRVCDAHGKEELCTRGTFRILQKLKVGDIVRHVNLNGEQIPSGTGRIERADPFSPTCSVYFFAGGTRGQVSRRNLVLADEKSQRRAERAAKELATLQAEAKKKKDARLAEMARAQGKKNKQQKCKKGKKAKEAAKGAEKAKSAGKEKKGKRNKNQ